MARIFLNHAKRSSSFRGVLNIRRCLAKYPGVLSASCCRNALASKTLGAPYRADTRTETILGHRRRSRQHRYRTILQSGEGSRAPSYTQTYETSPRFHLYPVLDFRAPRLLLGPRPPLGYAFRYKHPRHANVTLRGSGERTMQNALGDFGPFPTNGHPRSNKETWNIQRAPPSRISPSSTGPRPPYLFF